MLYSYKFPIYIFLIFEKCCWMKWFLNLMNLNHFYLYLQKNWFIKMNMFLKLELFLNSNSLVEHSVVDMYSGKNILFFFFYNHFSQSLFYQFYFYFFKYRITILSSSNMLFSKMQQSMSSFVYNANWLERESSEMYGFMFYNKKDSSKLLLEYSEFNYPLKKNFLLLNFNNLFFNFFEHYMVMKYTEKFEL